MRTVRQRTMPPLIVLVHGVLVDNPAAGIGRLRDLFERHGFDVEQFECGRLGFAGVRFANPNIAASLLAFLRQGSLHGRREVIPVGHSNGCCLIHLADRIQDDHAAVFERAAYLSPALDRGANNLLRRTDVFHSRRDRVVGWARWLPWHWWGDMGAVGFTGKNECIHNHDCTEHIGGHSDWWTSGALEYLRSTLVNPLAQQCGLTGGTPTAPLGFFN